MLILKKYISYILLLVFAWVIIPTHTIHDLFADHQDTADNFCLTHHSHLGTHIEEQHTHCDILKINTPVYSLPEPSAVFTSVSEISTLIPDHQLANVKPGLTYNLPSRAPPTI